MIKHFIIAILTTLILIILVFLYENKHLSILINHGLPTIDDYKIYGTTCREPVGSCDIVEHCSGSSWLY